MDKITKFKIPTKRRIVEEEAPEDDPEEESSSANVLDIPGGWDIIEATEEEKREIQELLNEAPKKNKGKTPSAEECWKQLNVENIQMIRNRRVKRSYDNYKKKHRILNDDVAYRVVYDTEEIRRIAAEGLSVNNDILIEIGDPLRGVVLFNSPAMSYASRYFYANMPITVMMFRTAIRGKRSEVTWGGQFLPSKNHTSHALMKTEAMKHKFHRYLLDHYEAAVYHYEYTENKSDVLKYPPMILPYAVITYKLPETAFPAHSPPKLSKINRSLMLFGDEEFCKHTLVLNSKEIQATVCLPSFLRDVPYILHNTKATPEACCMDNLSSFPELEILRSPDCFGKILSTDSVILKDSSLVTYYILRFSAEQKSFVDLFRKNKYMLVWRSYPFTVFYLPSGDISAEFGIPHKDNHMHLILHRLNPEFPEIRPSMSMFSYSETPLNYSLYWNKPQEYMAEAIEPADFEDAIYNDDYGDEEMEKREDEEEEEERRQPETEKTEELETQNSSKEMVDFEYTPPVGLKGICKTKPISKRLPVRWRDQEYPDHTPGDLTAIKFFDTVETSPHDEEDGGLSFNEKQKKEREAEKIQLDEEKRDRVHNDELFKNAIAGGASINSPSDSEYNPESVPYSPDYNDSRNISSPSVSPENIATPANESPGNTNTPSSLCAPSPDQPDFLKNIPQSFNVPPPNFPIVPKPVVALPIPTNIPPPPIRLIKNKAPPVIAPPPNFSIPPPSLPPHFSATPLPVPPPQKFPPPPLGIKTAPSNPLPAPGIVIPAALSKTSPRPSCLVADSGPPRDPRGSVDYVAAARANSSDSAEPTTPVNLSGEEHGEEPMDVDIDESFEDKKEDENEILEKCFTAGVPTSAPAPVPAPTEVLNHSFDMVRVMKLIERKKLESDSASSSSETDLQSAPPSKPLDTDLRKNPGSQVNFTFNKPKPVSLRPNALKDDSDEEMDQIPLPPNEQPSSSGIAKDMDYRKLPLPTLRPNSFPQDRDDRPTNLASKIISKDDGRSNSDNLQERLRALNDKVEQRGYNEHLSNNRQPAPVPPPQSGSAGLFLPNLMSASKSSLGLRGILSMRTSTEQPNPEPCTSSTSFSNNGHTSSSSMSKDHESTSSLTREFNKIMSPTPSRNEEKRPEEVFIGADDSDADSDIMIIDDEPSAPKPTTSRVNRTVLKPTDAPPGITRRDQRAANQNGPSTSFGNGNGNLNESWKNELPKFRSVDNRKFCIFFDPTENHSTKSECFRNIFLKLSQQNQLVSPAVESKVFIHHSVESNLRSETSFVPFYHLVNSFKSGPSPLIHSLPHHHLCDTANFLPKVSAEVLLNCILDVKTRVGGTCAIYLTDQWKDNSSKRVLFFEKNVKVMNIKELNSFIDECLPSS